MEYNPPFGSADPDAPYINGDPSLGIEGSIPPAPSIGHPQREIVNAISLSGLTPNAGDLTQLWQAIQRAVAAGALGLYAQDTGAANALEISLPQITTYTEGLLVLVKAGNTNTAPATLKLNALAAKSIVRRDGTALLPGDILAGSILPYIYDATRFQLFPAYGAVNLPFNTTIYVRPDGNNANDGSVNDSAHALLTLAAAVERARTFNPGEFTVTIQLADGTYTAGAALREPNGSGSIVIRGNPSSPSSCIINVPAGDGLYCQAKGYSVTGVALAVASATGGIGAAIRCEGGQILVGNVIFGTCAGPQIAADAGGIVTGIPGSTWTITGSAPSHMLANGGAIIDITGITLAQSGTTAFSTAFAVAQKSGTIQGQYSSQSIGGTVTGARYLAQLNGVIAAAVGDPNYFPGNSAGTSPTGGQYT